MYGTLGESVDPKPLHFHEQIFMDQMVAHQGAPHHQEDHQKQY